MYTFHTLHWGEKYNNEYPLRLYNNIKKYCKSDFLFHIITDQKQHDDIFLYKNIKISSLDKYSPIKSDRMFTYQKTVIQYKHNTGNNIILDLDFRFIKNCDDFLKNHFQINNVPTYNLSDNYVDQIKYWGFGSCCLVNSSIVLWKDKNATFIYEHIQKHLNQILYMYDSTDMYLNYVHFPKNRILLQNIACTYNYYLTKNCFGVCFPTSHTKYTGKKMIELHETELF